MEAQCRDDAMDATLREEQEAWMAIEQLRQQLAADAIRCPFAPLIAGLAGSPDTGFFSCPQGGMGGADG